MPTYTCTYCAQTFATTALRAEHEYTTHTLPKYDTDIRKWLSEGGMGAPPAVPAVPSTLRRKRPMP